MKKDQPSISKKESEQILHHILNLNEDELSLSDWSVESAKNPLVKDLFAGLLVLQDSILKKEKKNQSLTRKLQQFTADPFIVSDQNNSKNISSSYIQHRLEEALEMLIAISNRNFDIRLDVLSEDDEFDGLATGLNLLSEELQASSVSIEFLHDILNSMFEFLFILDNHGNVLETNAAVKNKLGYKPDELKKLNIFHLLPEEDQLKINVRFFNNIIKSDTRHFDFLHFLAKGGDEILTEASFSSMKDSRTILCVARDIREQKAAEVMREKMVADLQRKNKELEEFNYIISHDLKAPLRAISILADWIDLPAKDRESNNHLKNIKDNIRKLYNNIEAITDFAKIGLEDRRKHQCNLDEILHRINELLVTEKDKVIIEWSQDFPTIHAADPHMFQVFQNLISNAIKHNDKAICHIHIGYRETKKHWEFSVKDNGPGIKKEHHERIFKIFQALDYQKGEKNNGIGLAIVKKIISIYDGSVWVESQNGKGSIFHITLPKVCADD
ncbi:MAG: ATP-binding protein [Cyclobacteriaceae bacterium]|nr:ATP-binding protein [Cyclobacteriaceae bacterium]